MSYQNLMFKRHMCFTTTEIYKKSEHFLQWENFESSFKNQIISKPKKKKL